MDIIHINDILSTIYIIDNMMRHNIILSSIINIIMILAFSTWSIFASYHILGLIANKMYKPMMSDKRSNAEIVIVTIGSSYVKDSLLEAIKSNSKYGQITVLINEDAELLEEIRGIANTIIVPKEYRNDLIGKGRALNYFASLAKDDTWYIFLDDDNILLDDNILYEITAYDEKGYVAANPILVPRCGNSKITFVMDWVRYFDDLLTFKMFTGLLGKPLLGLHGEMLTVKGNVLKEIKFEHKTLTEDFRFASELIKKGYKTWQSSSKVSILSPNSMTDLFKQRGRWFKGLIGDIRYVPLLMKVIVGIRLYAWIMCIFGSWAFSPLWIYFQPFWYAIIGGAIYWYIYIYGVKRLGSYRYLLLIPVYGILEGFSWIRDIRTRNDKFVVINKNLAR